MMKVRGYLVLGFSVFIGLSLLVIQGYPSVDDLFVRNPYWNGLSEVYNMLEPVRVRDYGELYRVDPVNSTLLVVGPSLEFSDSDFASFRSYLLGGGTVVLADDFGSGDQILSRLGVDAGFSGELLLGSVFYSGGFELPRILNVTCFDVLGDELVLNYATFLTGEDVDCVVSSSPFTYSVVNGSRVVRAFPVIGGVNYGRGRVWVVSDSSLWINGMIERAGNRDLLLELVEGAVYIDEAHMEPSALVSVDNMLSVVDAYLGLQLVRVFIVGVLCMIVLQYTPSEPDYSVDEFEEVSKLHPGWDREVVEWLRERRG